MKHRIVIVGGGAAGFFAAIRCAELNPRLEIIIIEQGKSVLQKVKISGGGRCNVTHACWEPSELTGYYPRGNKELLGPFHRFCTGDTVAWFKERGVRLKIEEDNRMFPVTDSSQTIVDCLWSAAKNAGITVRTRTKMLDVTATEHGHWEISLSDGETLLAHKLMLATGSTKSVWDILKRLGHTIVKPVPSLFTFNIKDSRISGLAGVSFPKVTINIPGTKLEADGPLLITHWGLSGPAILKLSAWGARIFNEKQYHFPIRINLSGKESLETIFDGISSVQSKKKVANLSLFDLPDRFWKKLVVHSGIPENKPWSELSKKDTQKLALSLFQAEFDVNGKSTFKEEFVTAGGVALKEVDFKRFASRLHPNLYFAGEVLNIDAVTGGFNFQAAWTGGWICGEAMAE